MSSIGRINEKGKTKTFSAIKNAYSSLKKDFSNGTNNMAEAWIANDSPQKRQKAKKLKEGTLLMAKSMATNLKKSFKGVGPKAVICDVSYELGGVIQKTKQVFNEYIDDITRIPHGKK